MKVLLWCRYEDAEELAEIERQFDRIGEILHGTPGLLGSELLVSLSAQGVCVVLSEWASHAEFDAWERGNDHRGQTAAMRPFHDRQRNQVFDLLLVSRAHNATTNGEC
ncbi:antibiotic biosynthesis monooxygenase family protein [Nocardia sp. NPDC051570]|uniref:antibiotic biosynthesis monooxygenase family protein n=1 Tax=Nocardia sp. NPDC051570 TaxID=3364324 RepID=UPI0037971D26